MQKPQERRADIVDRARGTTVLGKPAGGHVRFLSDQFALPDNKPMRPS
jgi:hypothetical protein